MTAAYWRFSEEFPPKKTAKERTAKTKAKRHLLMTWLLPCLLPPLSTLGFGLGRGGEMGNINTLPSWLAGLSAPHPSLDILARTCGKLMSDWIKLGERVDAIKRARVCFWLISSSVCWGKHLNAILRVFCEPIATKVVGRRWEWFVLTDGVTFTFANAFMGQSNKCYRWGKLSSWCMVVPTFSQAILAHDCN